MRLLPSTPRGALRRSAAVGLALSTTAALAAVSTGRPASAEDPEPAPGLELSVPAHQVVYADGNNIYSDLGIRLIARGDSFELTAKRASYDDGIVVSASSGLGETTLPANTMVGFDGLNKFLFLDVQPVDRAGKPTGAAYRIRKDACLGGLTERVSPDSTATSPYPSFCYYNPYSLGAVQGIEEGWAATVLQPYGTNLKLPPGRYDIDVQVRPAIADALGLSTEQASQSTRVVVKKANYEGAVDRARRPGPTAPSSEPAAKRPTGPSVAPDAEGPRPDLQSLPAWGIQVSPNGKYLQFSATVWNAGDSPLVVDGFRRKGEDLMDAYQYFFDGAGNQVGYEPVGSFEWDPKPTHLHWHFQDFATYTLLRADKTAVVKSRKEAFCLANTDAVDLTVPEARWDIENEDLSTQCGEYTSLSIREALVSGWGDTYAQFRAGQSFSLQGLPNGVYYIEVAANPTGNLVESSEDNNVALRRIRLGGKPGARTVTVDKVGIIDEKAYTGGF